jgi:hypothetical protein
VRALEHEAIMTTFYQLGVRAARVRATADYYAQARPWETAALADRQAVLDWFVADAAEVLDAARAEHVAFGDLFKPRDGIIDTGALNAAAPQVQTILEAAIRYADQVKATTGATVFDRRLENLRESFHGTFDHWIPFHHFTKEQIAAWDAAGELTPIEEALREAETRLTPEERDAVYRRVAASR